MQKITKIFCIITLLLVTACAVNQTFNQMTKGNIRFPGGVYKDEKWDDPLYFKRASWYHGVTLYYDALLWQADRKSHFSKWFSEDDKTFLDKCSPLIIAINYSADSRKISHIMFREEMRLNGYDEVVIDSFGSYIRNHPTYKAWNLQTYQILSYCRRHPAITGSKNKVYINFPSFNELRLKITDQKD